MKIAIYILLLLLPSCSFAQQIQGTIKDQTGQGLDAATVTLYQNGELISIQTAQQGKFSLTGLNNLPYQLAVKLVGYQPLTKTFKMPIDSLSVVLMSEENTLQEVEVRVSKPLIERKVDRVVFNVENSITAASGSLWEALAKAPGVQTGSDGNIKAGSKGAVIYFNGKQIRLSEEDLMAYLQSIPSEQISKIEVMVNPSSKYDAQGGSVINIVTKKVNAEGFNASIGGGYTRGEANRFNLNSIFNFKTGKMNFFGSYAFTDNNLIKKIDSYNVFNSTDAPAYWQGDRLTQNQVRTNNYTAGMDLNLSHNQVLGFLFTGNNSANDGMNRQTTNMFNIDRLQIDSVQHTTGLAAGNGMQYSFNLNYRVKLDTLGSSLNFDVDYSPFSKYNVSTLNNLTQLADGAPSNALPYKIQYPSLQKINIWSGKVDFESSIAGLFKYESGAMYTSTLSENEFNFFKYTNNIPLIDLDKSDYFKYAEHTAGLYTNLSNTFGKWEFKAGIRAEYTKTKGESINLGVVNTNDYLRFYPTFFASYKSNGNNEFNLSYAKRIRRPDYSQLNPAKKYNTPYSYSNGNPFLKPSTITDLRLTYTFLKDYSLTAYHTQTNDLASNVTVQDNTNKTLFDTQENIGRIKETGFELSTSNRLTSWWEINTIISLSLRTQRSDRPGSVYADRDLFPYLRTDQSLRLTRDGTWKAELGAWYQGAFKQGILQLHSTYDLSMGISKSLFKNQAKIRFSASDILYGNKYTIITDNAQQQNGMTQWNDTRKFVISFTYKFGNSASIFKKRNTASEEERKRAN